MSELSQPIPGDFILTGSVTVTYFNEELYREVVYKASRQMAFYWLQSLRGRMSKRSWRRLRGRTLGRLTRR